MWVNHNDCADYDGEDYDDGRDEYDHCGEQADPAPCFDCTEDSDCPECAAALAWSDEQDCIRKEESAARAARENNPDHPDYVAF